MRTLMLALGLSSFLMLSACAKQEEAAPAPAPAAPEAAAPAMEEAAPAAAEEGATMEEQTDPAAE
jgi:uncharacterized lipoprotein YbaY